MLTERQQQVLDFIKETVAARGYPPSVREIGEAVGLSSPSTVHSHLNSLVEAGMIKKDPTKPRAIMIVDEEFTPAMDDRRMREVPVLGRIAAGTPILAAEHVEDVMPLPTELVGDGPVFLLEVKGDSMIDAGILDGDVVVVRRQDDALAGDIVVALVGEDEAADEATVKTFHRETDGRIRLQPENRALEPLYPEHVRILGKVTGVFRSLA